MNNSGANKSFVSVLFSPAVGLAILGTGAFIFSFYRAGQLANLALPKDFPKQSTKLVSAPPTPATAPTKVDVNSNALLVAIDASNPARLANYGNHKAAMEAALKNLTDNSLTDVANIALAGDIYSTAANKEDKELGFALLSKAMELAPNNQYLACRYAEKMAAAGLLEQATLQLSELSKKHPQLDSVHVILAKIFWQRSKSPAAVDELLKIKNGSGLSAKEQKEAALMFVKAGRILDGWKLFRLAMSGRPETRFYAAYCGNSLPPSVDDYKTALAVIEANLSNNAHPDLPLEIKHAVLLMLLDRNQEAKAVLEQSLIIHKNNVDLQTLLSAALFAAGNSDQAMVNLELAAKYYQPKL